MERRTFLKSSCLQSAALSAGLAANSRTLFAQPKDTSNGSSTRTQPVIVQIFLRGGQDQLNTFIPHTDRTYYNIRPTINVPIKNVLKVDKQFGFHPALSPLEKAFREEQFAVVINSGSPHSTRSHFDAQDFMEYGAPGDRSVHNGWLNRYLTATKSPRIDETKSLRIRALAMQERLPRSLRGSYPVVAVPSNLKDIDEVLDLFENMYSTGKKTAAEVGGGFLNNDNKEAVKEVATAIESTASNDPVLGAGLHTINYLRRLKDIIHGPESEQGKQTAYPDGTFANRLKMLARVIKSDAGLEIGAVDINGWDHHIGLGSMNGTLNRMLTSFAAGLAAFLEDLGEDRKRTLVIVSTEFGRVAAENGNDGSDHGHGGATWLLGGNCKGGKFHGKWTGLEPAELNDKRDLKVTTDFRDIYADALREHLKFDLPRNFFPKFSPTNKGLGLFKS